MSSGPKYAIDSGYTGHISSTSGGTPIVSDVSTPSHLTSPTVTSGSNIALKFDSSKIRMELLSAPALEAIAQVLTVGAVKYADHNWRKGFAWSRLFGAALRHLLAALRGEDRDPETGLLHLAHAGCCIMFLLEHVLCGLGTDDRHVTVSK